MSILPWIGVVLLLALTAILLVYRDRLKRDRKRQVRRNHHLSAMEALADGDDDRALGELQQAVQLGQGGVDAYLRLAEIYRGKGQYKKAIHVHRTLAVKTSWSLDVKLRILRGLAEDYLAAGRAGEALKQLEELRKLDPKDAAVMRRLSQALLRKGEGDKAEQALRRAHRLEGQSRPDELAILQAEQARGLMKGQRWREVRRALQAALKLDETCLPALRISADLYLHEGREQDAADALQTLVMTGAPGTEMDYSNMEKLFFELGRFQEIQFVYQEVISKNPDFWPARFALAAILEKRGRRDEAIRLLAPNDEASDEVAGMAASRLLEWNDQETASRWLERWRAEVFDRTKHYRCTVCGMEQSRPRWYCSSCHAFKSYEPVRENSKAATAI